MNLVPAVTGAVHAANRRKRIPNILYFIGCTPFCFRSERARSSNCSLREELRTCKSCSLGPFQARQSDRDPVIAAYFDFQSDARLEIEVKVKFAELVGRCKGVGALAAVEYDGNQIELTVGLVGIHNLAHESEVMGIGLRLEPEIHRETSGLIDQLPGRKLRDATDARGLGLEEAV